MVRRTRRLARLGVLAFLGLLGFPGAGSALRPTYDISLTSSGPSPSSVSSAAGLGQFEITNTDTVAHTISFANGSCSEQVAAGANADCNLDFLGYAGHYGYTEDGTTAGEITIQLVGRSVSLGASGHAVRRGSLVTLHGRLQEDNANWSPPSAGIPQRIIVVARPYAKHPFHRVAAVVATVHRPKHGPPYGELLWQATIHPRFGMTYVAIASVEPAGGWVWRRAVSHPLRIAVR